MDRLEEMLHAQRELQELINGYTLESQSDELRIANIKESYVALIKELGEVLDEIGWKSWATSRHINYEAARGEVVDCWHFLMNLALHLNVTADDLYEGYRRKREKNERRQREGYDGVTGKCPHCRRSYDDQGVRCTPSCVATGGTPAWCVEAGRLVGPGTLSATSETTHNT